MTFPVHNKKALCTAFVLTLALIEASCGDVYRPVAQVIPGTPPNPGAVHFVITLSTNGKIDRGTADHVDVSGDTSLGAFLTGLTPVHAALTANATRLFVANLGDNTVAANVTSSPTSASVISLAQGAQPVFVHTTENNNVYVANFGTSTVSVINANSNALAGPDVAVGANPVALAEMPVTGATNQKLYVANENSSNMSVINVLDDSLGAPVAIGTGQVWTVARSDGQRIYVLDRSGTVSAVNTLTDVVMGTASAGAGANFMFLDAKAHRLYVTNPSPAAHSLSIFDISELNGVAVALVTTIDLGQGAAPFYLPTSVTGIGDGSRAYVASYQIAKCQPNNYDCVNTQVAVINVGNNTVSKIVPIATGVPINTSAQPNQQDGCGGTAPPPAAWTPADGARFRVFATASGGGSTSNFKVYVAQCDAQNVAVIDTFAANSNPADTFAGVAIPSPLSAFPGVQVGISAAAQSSTTTTYNYTQSSASPNLQVGQNIFITGMSDAGNNGSFMISGGNLVSGPGSGTFTVTNPSGVTNATQSGTGAVLLRQNPVFIVAGP